MFVAPIQCLNLRKFFFDISVNENIRARLHGVFQPGLRFQPVQGGWNSSPVSLANGNKNEFPITWSPGWIPARAKLSSPVCAYRAGISSPLKRAEILHVIAVKFQPGLKQLLCCVHVVIWTAEIQLSCAVVIKNGVPITEESWGRRQNNLEDERCWKKKISLGQRWQTWQSNQIYQTDLLFRRTWRARICLCFRNKRYSMVPSIRPLKILRFITFFSYAFESCVL